MNRDPAAILALVQGLAAFVLVLAVFGMAALLLTARRRRERAAVERRLAGEAAAEPGTRTLRLWHEGGEATLHVRGTARGDGLGARLRRLCDEAGWTADPRLIAGGVAGVSCLAFAAILAASGRFFPATVGAFSTWLVFWSVARKRAVARTRVFEQQFLEALELSARALRAGHPLLASFRLIAEEIPAPVGAVFAGIVQQQAMGMRLDEALRAAAHGQRSADLDLFAAALSIHSRTGGNLADVMQGLALVIRERMRLGRRFRVLIAQTQVSKRILLAMPCVMFGVLHLISPEYMEALYVTPAGQFLLLGAIGSLGCGWLVMNRMADLKAS